MLSGLDAIEILFSRGHRAVPHTASMEAFGHGTNEAIHEGPELLGGISHIGVEQLQFEYAVSVRFTCAPARSDNYIATKRLHTLVNFNFN